MKLNDHLYFYQEGGMLDCNTYLIKAEKTMIVDVGLDQNLPLLIAALQQDGIDPHDVDVIANTHLHIDHMWANEMFKNKFNARIEIAPVQKEYYEISVRQATRFFGLEPVEFQEDGFLDSTITLGTIEIELIPTPGHSPESICFYCRESKALICGDLIFYRNIGRSDLPGGNSKQLKQSIEKVSELEIEFLLPGHMGILTDAKEVKKNFDYVRNQVFRWL
ncbi:MAG: MBL fold metallo-hydrolase [Pseudomonadota bacterium]